MADSPLFAGPRSKLAHARRHSARLRQDIEAFGKSTEIKYGWRDVEDASLSHMREVRFVFSQRPPEDIPLQIGDVVHNLRSALDIMMCDIARLKGRSASGVHFPFAESADALEKRLAHGAIRGLGPEVVNLVRTLGPHKDGHQGLRGLHDLDIADKHKLVLPTYLVAWATIPMMQLMDQFFPGISQARTPVHEGSGMYIAKGTDPRSVLQFVEGGPKPVYVADMPFAGEPVIEVLEGLAVMTEELIDLFVRTVEGSDQR